MIEEEAEGRHLFPTGATRGRAKSKTATEAVTLARGIAAGGEFSWFAKAGDRWAGRWVYASQQRRGRRCAHSSIACRAFNDHTDSHPCERTYHSEAQLATFEEEQQAASPPASPGQGSKGRREQGGVDR